MTNPPIDAIREEIVTSTLVYLGPEGDLLSPSPQSCRQLRLSSPLMTDSQRALDTEGLRALTLSILYDAEQGEEGMRSAMDRVCRQLDEGFEKGYNIFILSDRGVDEQHAAIPSLLAVSGVQAHTLRRGIRTQMSIVLESGEPTAVHHLRRWIGYGATAINPYLALRTVREGDAREALAGSFGGRGAGALSLHAVVKGVVKTMSKMGISTVQSYRGSQLFEAVLA